MKSSYFLKTMPTLAFVTTGILTILFLISAILYEKKIYIDSEKQIAEKIFEYSSPAIPQKLSLFYTNEENQKEEENLSQLKYPNSKVVNQDKNAVLLTSKDNPDKIIDWYKEQLKKSKMDTEALIQIKNNGDILNRFTGIDGKTELGIEIFKSSYELEAKIFITITKTLDHKETF